MNRIDNLYSKMKYIGIRTVSAKEVECDIEETIIECLLLVDKDSRIFSLLLSWLDIHHKKIIADKLFREYHKHSKNEDLDIYFSAICSFLVNKKDHRFKKGVTKRNSFKYVGNRNQESKVKIKGAVPYFLNIGLIVPNGDTRIRESDVLSPSELAKANKQYKNRLIYGANWRSEVILLINEGIKNSNQISIKLGINRTRVREIFVDYSHAI